LVEEDRTGTENYLYNVLRNLSAADLMNAYICYFRDAPSEIFWRDISSSNVRWTYRVVSPFISWTQVGLARQSFLDKPDRLICAWHTLPVLHYPSTRVISIIHDFSCNTLLSYPIYASLLLADKVIGVSDYTYRGILRRVPWRASSVYKQYEGVDVSRYNMSSSERVASTKHRYGLHGDYFLSVGTLSPRKNLENMISAVSQLLTERPDLHVDYAIVGRCSKGYDSIYKYAQATQRSVHIKFLGRLDDQEVVDLYTGALSLLYASKDEGFGLPILEAMACNCLVVTSDVSSMIEVGGDSALYVHPNSVASIKDMLYYVVNPQNSARLLRLKSMGVARSRNFDWRSCADSLRKIF
jgi:glycosyltransferase involved in cell wall biosynthesis